MILLDIQHYDNLLPFVCVIYYVIINHVTWCVICSFTLLQTTTLLHKYFLSKRNLILQPMSLPLYTTTFTQHIKRCIITILQYYIYIYDMLCSATELPQSHIRHNPYTIQYELHYITLHYTIPYCKRLHHRMQYCTILYFAMLHYITLPGT